MAANQICTRALTQRLRSKLDSPDLALDPTRIPMQRAAAQR